ncbi:hypothetical protein SAMN03159341_10749 [Paenibacillus sp. 1_12]|nr:hypothetical protein SAMN03159341_10749 [Paenibacillus sp. 1_12]
MWLHILITPKVLGRISVLVVDVLLFYVRINVAILRVPNQHDSNKLFRL